MPRHSSNKQPTSVQWDRPIYDRVVSDARAICADCGHVQSWHDRDAARKMRSGELASDRRCYREVGGAGCRCGGFQDSGELALAGPRPRTGRSVLMSALLTLLLVVMGLVLLYSYRSQVPAIPSIAMSQAIHEVSTGQVIKVTITGTRATLELRTGEKHQATLPDRDEVFQKALTDYNAANPGRQVAIDYQQESAPFGVIGSIFLSLLPVLLIGGLFYSLGQRAIRR
jgi:hypothetical protein